MTSGLATARGLILVALCLSAAMAAPGALASPPTIEGMRSQPELALPSVTRVIVAATITLGLAAIAIVLLKRLAPNTAARRTGGGVIRVLARANVTTGLRAHVVEIDATRVLIVEGRNGVGLTLLPKPDSGERPPSP
jgi:hypothetical protein